MAHEHRFSLRTLVIEPSKNRDAVDDRALLSRKMMCVDFRVQQPLVSLLTGARNRERDAVEDFRFKISLQKT